MGSLDISHIWYLGVTHCFWWMSKVIWGQQESICENHVNMISQDRSHIWYVRVHIGYKKPISHHLRSADVIVIYSGCHISTCGTINYCNVTKTKRIAHPHLMQYVRFMKKNTHITSSKPKCICTFWFSTSPPTHYLLAQCIALTTLYCTDNIVKSKCFKFSKSVKEIAKVKLQVGAC